MLLSVSKCYVLLVTAVQCLMWVSVEGAEGRNVLRLPQELQEAGKIRHVGVTNFDVPRLKQIVDSGVRIVSNQVMLPSLQHPSFNSSESGSFEPGTMLATTSDLAGVF